MRCPAGIRRALFGTAAFVIAIAAWQDAGAQVKATPPPEFPLPLGGGFSLTDQDGETRTDRDFRGRFLLVYFGYTRCPHICLDGLEAMAASLELLMEAQGRVQPLFITVDPGRDRPDQIRAFVSKIHPRLIGLTGTETQIRAVAKAYRIFRRKVVLPDEPVGDYLVSHTPTTFLMGPDGEFVALYPHGTKPAFIAASIRRHISEYRDTG